MEKESISENDKASSSESERVNCKRVDFDQSGLI